MLGAEHPSMLTSMDILALTTYSDQERWDEVEKLKVQVMETRKKVLGSEHLGTLMSMANLVRTLSTRGSNQSACALVKDYASISYRILGRDHPYTVDRDNTVKKWKESDC